MIVDIRDAFDNLNKIVEIIKSGGIALLPTDTLYALCADATNESAVEKIFSLKQRDVSKKLPVFVSSIEQARLYAHFDDLADDFAKKVWPGNATLLLKSKKHTRICDFAKSEKIALRIPANKLIKQIVDLSGPLTGTSANISGAPNVALASDLPDHMLNLIDCVVSDVNYTARPPSTIIDVSGITPIVIR